MLDALNRNVVLLFLAQLIFVSGSVLLFTIGGIVGSELAPNPNLATLPVSLQVVGTALATIPAALLMQRIGRRLGFCFAALTACAAALLAAWSLGERSFLVFCIAAAGLGSTLAFSQQFRFAAAESVAPDRVSYAVAIILLGSIGGAFLGPEFVARSPNFDLAHPFQAGFYAAAACYLIASMLMLGVRNHTATSDVASDAVARPLIEVISQPLFIVAVLAGVAGQGAMTFIMTATPVSMHVVEGHDLASTAGVIRAHVIAMYLPSLVAAPLIGRFGPRKLMITGTLAMLITVVIGFSGHAVMHYWFALVLLGIGWNFLYLGGTTLLVTTYRSSERFRAQAVNEFSVFGVSALASLLAGSILHSLGWLWVVGSVLPILVGMLLVVVWSLHRSPAVASS